MNQKIKTEKKLGAWNFINKPDKQPSMQDINIIATALAAVMHDDNTVANVTIFWVCLWAVDFRL